jgi:hypothetical protein
VVLLGLPDPEDETFGCIHPTQHYNLEDLHHQQACKNLKSHTVLLLKSYIFSAVSFILTYLKVTMATAVFFHIPP